MKKQIVGSLAMGLLLVVGITGPVFAQDRTDSARARAQEVHATENKVAEGTEAEKAMTAERIQKAREDAKLKAEEMKAKAAERKAEIKQEVCERRKAQLAKALPNLANNATKLQSAIDTMYGRVQGFYESGQLTVANYDELNAQVQAAQLKSAAAVRALDEIQVEVDCDQPGLGQQLDAYRQAVGQARGELKAYRKALVTLISAMKSAAAEERAVEGEEETTETTNNTTETEGSDAQ